MELVDGVVQPRFSRGDFPEKRDAGLADFVPDAIAVTVEGTVQMADAAADFTAIPGVPDAAGGDGLDLGSVLVGKDIVGPVVGSSRPVEQRFARFAVQLEIGRAVRVPGGQMQDPAAGRLSIFAFLGNEVHERQRLGFPAGLLGLFPIGPPVLDQFRVFLVAGRTQVLRFGSWSCLDDPIGFGPQRLKLAGQRAGRHLAQPGQIFRRMKSRG